LTGRLIWPALAACALAACGGAGGTSGSVERGLAALAAGDPRTARIELMNAARAQPEDGRIRLLAATAHLALGDGVSAESDLARARRLGIAPEATHHLMAHALLLQGKAEAAIAESELAPSEHAAYAARIRGNAGMAMDDIGAATAAYNDALSAGGDDALLWTDIARFRRTTGESAGAIEAAGKAVALDPENVEALILNGELTRSQYGLAAAIPWFDRALARDPRNLTALAERAATFADMGEMRAMLADARAMLAIQPSNPVAYFLEAMLAARAGNYDLARAVFRRTEGALDDQPAAMLLAGAIDFQTGHPDRAVRQLSRLVADQPDNAKARRLLAAAHWRMGDAMAVVRTLAPLADRADADPYVLTLIAEANAKAGDKDAASWFFARAARPVRADSAVLGDPLDDRRLGILRADAERAPGDAGLQIELVRALIARGATGEALARARGLQGQNPGAHEAHVLAGDALGMAGDWRAAAGAYRRAANIAFTEPVALRLIEALRNGGDRDGAGRVLGLFLSQNPTSVPGQMLAAASMMEQGNWHAAIRVYEGLRKRLGSRDATLMNNLAWAYGQTGDIERALPFAQRAWQLDRNNPATADTYGWLLYKSGRDKARGLVLIEQAARGAPSDRTIRAHLERARG